MVGCGADDRTSTTSAPPVTSTPIHTPPVNIALPIADTSELRAALDDLAQSVQTYLMTPDRQAQAAAQSAWLRLHRHWHALEPWWQSSLAPARRSRVHAWPLLPGYLDDIPEYPDSGLVHDLSLPLTAVSLRQQHQQFDAEEVVLGLHAIEFLLWQSPERLQPQSLDSQWRERGYSREQLPNNRRRVLLQIQVEALQDELVAQADKLQNARLLLSAAAVQRGLRQLGAAADAGSRHFVAAKDDQWLVAALAGWRQHPLVAERLSQCAAEQSELECLQGFVNREAGPG